MKQVGKMRRAGSHNDHGEQSPRSFVVRLRRFAYAACADGLTVSRFAIGGYFLWLAWQTPDIHAVRLAILGFILGWTTDIADGRFARASGRKSPGVIGSLDFGADLFMTASLFVLFWRTALFPTWLAVVYGAAALFFSLLTGNKSVAMGFAFGVDLYAFYLSFHVSLALGLQFLAWIVLVLIIDFARFKEVVNEFVENAGLSETVKRSHILSRIFGWCLPL